MSAAHRIIKANLWKYDQRFYRHLPLDIHIYISEDGELFIDPTGGEAPNDVIIKRTPNPDYYTGKMRSSGGINAQGEMRGSIVEEDLSE